MRKKIIATICILLLSPDIFAQMGRFFDADKHLSNSFTHQVYLDNNGFIWSVTRNGLNKYDGYQFNILRKEQKNGMASNYVNCMIQDSKGTYYIGMWGALQTYDSNQFKTIEVKDKDGNHVETYVTCFLERRNGEVWVGTSGMGVLKIGNSLQAHRVEGALNTIHTVLQLMEDNQGRLWVLTRDHGLICDNGKTAHTYFSEAPMSTYLTKICQTKDGSIYLGTSMAGLYTLSENGFVQVESTGDKPIIELYGNSKGELMLGYSGAGLGVYDPHTGVLTDNPFHSQEIDLSKSDVACITEDNNSNFWFGLQQKGIYMQPGSSTGFHYMGYKSGTHNLIGTACVSSTYVDRKGRIWIGTDKDGLYSFDSDRQLLKHYKENFPASVITIAEDQHGRIWIGSYNEGGGWIDAGLRKYHPYDFPQAANIGIYDIQADNKNRLWMATMGYGVLMIDLTTNKMVTYQTESRAETDRQVNSISNNYVSQLSLSPDNKRIYAATAVGVCCLDIEENSWISVFGRNCLNHHTPTRVVKEFYGKLWIGTNDGLECYDLADKELQEVTTEKGLSGNGIASIEQDLQGRLWISTDHGLFCYNPMSGLTENYFVDDGLQSNEFSNNASWTSSNGIMLFGGIGGVTWFNPVDIRQGQWNAQVELITFSIHGEPVNPTTKSGKYQVTDTTVIASNRFELDYEDNSFAIRLSTLTYETPEHLTYWYSINGEPYVPLKSGSNEIAFSHLSPGTYHFSVKAELNNMETPTRRFTVIVRAPWYRTTWAYFFYALAIGLSFRQYLRTRRRKEQDRLRLQEHIHAQELGEAKLRFFINLSHDIRTPMTLIITPLLSLIRNEDDPQRKSVYEMIKRNADRILHLINQMMDLQKIDKGLMQMHMTETDLVEFIREIHTLFEHQAKSRQITFTYQHDTEKLPVWIDRSNFDKVVINILSNAFKYTPIGGEINIRTKHTEKNAMITFSNNGEKIPEDKLGHIFERFYQTVSTINDNHAGTGIGLDLVRSLVELHHGTITVRNLEQGCEFVVSIPLGNKHLCEENIVCEQENATSRLPASGMEEVPEETQFTLVPKSNRRKTLVVAEDDDEIRNYIQIQLEKDYDIRICTNGQEAYTETLRTMPDLVLSDVMMPEMDGHTLCSKLKTNPNTNHIPIILLTARNRDEEKLEGLETGADAYIVKPFSMDILQRTIINLIHSHQLLKLKYERVDKLEEQVERVRMKSPDERLLERVMASINKHLKNPELSVDMIAEEVGISRVHLYRKMKELTGQAPRDFIRNIRLKQAANLLANSGMNVAEVTYACGFSNQTFFSTLFRKFYGMSPRDYMKEHDKQ